MQKKKEPAQFAEIGKEIKMGQNPETAKAEAQPQPKLSPEEEKRRALIQEVEESLSKIRLYPVACTEEGKDQSISALKKIYADGDESMRQIILYLLHETISQFSDYRAPKNLDYFKKRFPQNDQAQNRMNVYRGMFNYPTSIEGIMEMISLISTFGDAQSAKLLTHEFSFLCSFDGSEGARMLRNSVADALGDCDSPYALKCLINYAKTVESESLAGRIASSLMKWKDKLEKAQIPAKQKDAFHKEISEILMIEKEGRHYS